MTRRGKMALWPREMRAELKARPHHGDGGRPCKAQFPGLDLDGLRHEAGRPPPELGAGAEANARRRSRTGPGEPRDLAEALIKANQTQSNRIKPDQTRGWGEGLRL